MDKNRINVVQLQHIQKILQSSLADQADDQKTARYGGGDKKHAGTALKGIVFIGKPTPF
jgi:hypothetical protein